MKYVIISLFIIVCTVVVVAGSIQDKQQKAYGDNWLHVGLRLHGELFGESLTKQQVDSLLLLPRVPVVDDKEPVIINEKFLWHDPEYTRVIVFGGLNGKRGYQLYDVRIPVQEK